MALSDYGFVALHMQAWPPAAKLLQARRKYASMKGIGINAAPLIETNTSQRWVHSQPVKQCRSRRGAPVEPEIATNIQQLQGRRTPQHSNVTGHALYV